MYRLVTYDDDEIFVTDEQANKLIEAMKIGAKRLELAGQIISTANIASILEVNRLVNRTKMGKLHDGSLVRRHFGEWVDFYDPEVKLLPDYYPEVKQDCVPSVEDYDLHIAPLPREERLAAMQRIMLPDMKDQERKRRLISGDLENISKQLKPIEELKQLNS